MVGRTDIGKMATGRAAREKGWRDVGRSKWKFRTPSKRRDGSGRQIEWWSNRLGNSAKEWPTVQPTDRPLGGVRAAHGRLEIVRSLFCLPSIGPTRAVLSDDRTVRWACWPKSGGKSLRVRRLFEFGFGMRGVPEAQLEQCTTRVMKKWIMLTGGYRGKTDRTSEAGRCGD